MSAIPLGLSAYARADLPPVTLKNFFYEKTPANQKDGVVLIPRRRLKQSALVGDGPVRGLFRKGGSILGKLLALSDDKLYAVAADASSSLIGTVDGANRMSAEANEETVVLTCGATPYSTDGATLSVIVMPDAQNVIAVDTLNSYFLLAAEKEGRFYWTAVGGTTVDALDYATAESQPDGLTTLKVIGDELILVGRDSTEFWQPTGDLDLPFRRIGGRTFGVGCEYADTVQKLLVNGLDTLCFAGTDGKVYRTAPNPERISDHGMEERLTRATGPLYSTKASWNGHDFYILHIPGEGSFAFDMATGFWDEWTSHGRPLFRGQVAAVGYDAQPLLGDDQAGIIWELSESERTDANEPVVFEFTGLVENFSAPKRAFNVALDCSVGLTPDPEADPMMLMATSRDGGSSFGNWMPKPLGRQGERHTRLTWAKLGMIRRPGMVFKWRTIEPVTIRRAKLNESFR